MIAKNVTIADGCFISAMSLVNKDVLIKNTVMGGTCSLLKNSSSLDGRTAV